MVDVRISVWEKHKLKLQSRMRCPESRQNYKAAAPLYRANNVPKKIAKHA